jgi:hypothetical protein
MTTIEIANRILPEKLKVLTIKDITYENDSDNNPTYGVAYIEIPKDYLISHSTPSGRDTYKLIKNDQYFPWSDPPPNPNYPDIRVLKDFADSIDEKTYKKIYHYIYQSHYIATGLRFKHLSIRFGPYEGFFDEPLEYF